MKYIKTFEANFSDKIKDIFRNDVYFIDEDDYIYPDGFSRNFKRGDIVVLYKNAGFTRFEIGDKFRVLRMEGKNAKVMYLRSDRLETMSLDNLLSEEDYELAQSTNKYNL